MKKDHIFKSWFYLFLVILSGLFFGCGGGGGGNDSGSPPDNPINIAGSWWVTSTMGGNTCGDEEGIPDSYQVTVSKNGSALTVTTPAGTFNGSINGNTISWTGSYPEEGGTTTITSMHLTVTADGSSFSGSDSWSWTDGVETCTGSSSVSGSLQSGSSTTIPSAPSALNATAASSSSINLSWTDSSNNETGFKIEISTSSTTGFSEIATVGANVKTYSATGLTPATAYWFKVKAYNDAGESSDSNIATATTQSSSTGTGPSPSDTVAYAKAMVVGAWTYAGTFCDSVPADGHVEPSYFICPAGGLKGVEKLYIPGSEYDYVAKGTYDVVSGSGQTNADYAHLFLDYTTEINIGGVYDSGPGTLGASGTPSNAPMFYDPQDDLIIFYFNGCYFALDRLVDGGNTDVDDSYCGSTPSGTSECGTDADCGRCWYCDTSGSSNVCRYGGEGPYGCYRGWEPPQ